MKLVPLKTCPNMEDSDKELDRDEIDRLPAEDRATNWDIAGFVISIISHILDLFFDCNLAYRYYINDKLLYFYITLSFILIPALINTAFSIQMYMEDSDSKHKFQKSLTKRVSKRNLCLFFVFLFQLAPVLRYFDALQYAIKSKKAEKAKDIHNQRKYYELMVKEDSDVALLRVLECFLEAAPQQILQLTILFYTHGQELEQDTFSWIHQFLSIGSSFVSMAWSMASYQRLLRVSLKNKSNITWIGTCCQFMWHFLVTVSRILCISVIASIFPSYTIIALILHWFLMVIWLLNTNPKNNFCNQNQCSIVLFYSTFGTVYIFTFVTLHGGSTCSKYLFFYVVLFLENTVANWVWFNNTSPDVQKTFYYMPIFYLNILPFLFGLVFMIMYYKCFHPTTGYSSRQSNVNCC